MVFFFKIDSLILDLDPNWAKILDPDPNSMYLDPQHWLPEVLPDTGIRYFLISGIRTDNRQYYPIGYWKFGASLY